ncbi:unnamed protein product [Auanema sp. JU1783]|nr:unnamed protein product [Auanema sp. JU1783]
MSNIIQHVRPFAPYAVIPAGIFAIYKLLNWFIPGPHHHRKLTFKDKTVLITGASSGLGRQLAFDLYKKGAKLILVARSIDKLKKLCEELKTSHPDNPHEPEYEYLDIADTTIDVTNLRKRAIDGQTIDILINNAGISMRGRIDETPISIHKQVMDVNYFGQIDVTMQLLPYIPDDGCIIVISSVQGKIPVPYRSSYAASKHALQAFFDTLRSESRPKLHILVVSAGYMNTGFGSRALDVDGKPTGQEDENQLKVSQCELLISWKLRKKNII